MASAPEPTGFASLLRQHRLAAHLTQEALAERAGMSARGIQNLEGGVTHPYRDSAHRLAAALDLTAAEQAVLLAAAQPVPRRVRSTADGAGSPVRHNLPLQVTSFVGRERELAEIRATLARTRLLTLTGTGGCGKTRLALQVAADVRGRFPDGVWLVELAPLADPVRVVATVAGVLGVREQPSQPLLSTLVAVLRPWHLLLVLDNCEHLLDACARLADALVRSCPHLTILATSRQALGTAGETRRRVPSLAVPAAAVAPLPEVLAGSEAVQLFCERAAAVRPDFALTEQNAAAVAELCRRLGGIPLALELAAARTAVLGVRDLLEHLDERFLLLTGGNRTALPRQQTLRATLDWSYGLLLGPERRLFARLSIFAGGWTLEAAETVCSGDGMAKDNVLDLLARLAEQSLVQAEEQPDGGTRYRLLETLRQYSREKLLASGEADAVSGRHATYYLALAERAEPHLWGAQQLLWHRRLVAEHDNLWAALRWWLDRSDAEHTLGMWVALWDYWYRHGYLAQPPAPLSELVTLAGVAPTALRVRAQLQVASFASWNGDRATAEALVQDSLALAQESGDARSLARALSFTGFHSRDSGHYAEAQHWLGEAAAAWRTIGDIGWLSHVLCFRARAANAAGDPAGARADLEEALALARRAGDLYHAAMAAEFLGEVASTVGDDGEARTRLEAALALYRETGDSNGIATVAIFLGGLALRQGDVVAARQQYQTGLELARAVGFLNRVADGLEGLAMLAGRQAQPERALCLAGAAEAVRVAISVPAAPHEHDRLEQALGDARRSLGEQAAAAYAAGRAMTLEQAVAEAMEEERNA